MERETGRPRGFAYVEYETVEEAAAAMEATKESEFNGRNLRLDYAPPRRTSDTYGRQ